MISCWALRSENTGAAVGVSAAPAHGEERGASNYKTLMSLLVLRRHTREKESGLNGC